MSRGIGVQAGKQFGIHSRHTFRCFEQARTFGVFTDRLENLSHGEGNPRLIDR